MNCTATDAAGNQSSGSFSVKVTVAWTGFLAPVNADGSSRFPLGLPLARLLKLHPELHPATPISRGSAGDVR